MDEPRDVSPGAERFSTAKQSGHKALPCKDFEFSKKSKKKMRSLSAVGRAFSSYEDYGMGCDISGSKDALPAKSPSSNIIASKRLKLSYDRNGVDHVSVPRKLRSAMKKRNRESYLLDSEKGSHTMNGIESAQKYGIKKSKKQGSTDWSPRPTVSGPITKDEEEVVETLYALAGMFPDNCSNNRSELVGKSLPENSSVLQELQEGTKTAFEDSRSAHHANPSFAERSPVEATKTSSLSETVDQEQPDLPERANFLMASDNIASKMNQQNMPSLVGRENANKVELSLAMRLNKPRQSPIPRIERRPEMALEKAMGDECKQEQHMIKDQKKNEGSALWPGLSPVASAGSHASCLQSAAARHPVWPDAAICTSKQDLMKSNSSGGKISEVVIHRRPWKRSAAHVHIGHLIRSLQVPNSKDMLLQQPNQSNQSPAQGSKHGVLMEVHDLKGMRNGITFAPGTIQSATTKNSHETKKGILQRHYHEKSRAIPTHGVYGPQKQSFDSLSLSAGGSELEVNNNSSNKVGRRLEPFSDLQVPYFHSPAQQHDGLMSLPLPQSQYASPSYLDHAAVAAPQVWLQLPHYNSSPLSGTHSNWRAPKKQKHQSPSFWGVPVGAGVRPAINCNTMRTQTQYPNWQSRGQDSPAVSPCGQVIFPNSPAFLEALRSKITPITGQQQQQLIALSSSFPPSRTTSLHLLPPSVVEESRGRFRSTNGTSSLQLLCDERI